MDRERIVHEMGLGPIWKLRTPATEVMPDAATETHAATVESPEAVAAAAELPGTQRCVERGRHPGFRNELG